MGVETRKRQRNFKRKGAQIEMTSGVGDKKKGKRGAKDKRY